LAFLIFVMPQFLQWARQSNHNGYRFTVITVLILVYLSCWHFVIWYAPILVNTKEFVFIFDETFNWMLVAGLSYLLFASTPDWVREQFRFLFSRRNSVQMV